MKLQKKKIISLLLMLCLIFGMIPNTEVKASAQDSAMAVHFIDIGQGLSVLVQSGGQNLLYDGGDQEHSDQLVAYLQQQKVQTIDYMISSHYDEDHVGGLIKCIDTFSVTNLFGSDYIHDSNLYNTFMNTATANAVTVQYPAVGDTFTFGTGSFTVLAPDGINPNDSNNNSIAIKLENGTNSFLFTGDAEETSEQDMISTGANLDCDVLSVGHHGSSSSTSWDFLEATTPAYAVISCGTGNQYNHPSADTMNRLSDMSIPVFRTDKQGTLIAVSDGSSISWSQDPCNDYSSGEPVQEVTVPSAPVQEQAVETYVWLSATGEKYHSIPNCGRMNPDKAHQITKSQAESEGYGACSKCW